MGSGGLRGEWGGGENGGSGGWGTRGQGSEGNGDLRGVSPFLHDPLQDWGIGTWGGGEWGPGGVGTAWGSHWGAGNPWWWQPREGMWVCEGLCSGCGSTGEGAQRCSGGTETPTVSFLDL